LLPQEHRNTPTEQRAPSLFLRPPNGRRPRIPAEEECPLQPVGESLLQIRRTWRDARSLMQLLIVVGRLAKKRRGGSKLAYTAAFLKLDSSGVRPGMMTNASAHHRQN